MVSNLNPVNNAPVPMNNRQLSWYKSQTMKAYLLVIGIIGVILIVLFSRQIGDLLKWLASQAALENRNINLTFDQAGFPTSGYSAERFDTASNTWVPDDNSVTVDNTNRLILNPQ